MHDASYDDATSRLPHAAERRSTDVGGRDLLDAANFPTEPYAAEAA